MSDINKNLEFNEKTNLLEKSAFEYSLQDVAEPNLHRLIFDYEHIPKIIFNRRLVPMRMPKEI